MCSPSIRGFFQKCIAFIPEEGARLSRALAVTLDAVESAEFGTSITPGSLVREIRMSNAMFQGYGQQVPYTSG